MDRLPLKEAGSQVRSEEERHRLAGNRELILRAGRPLDEVHRGHEEVLAPDVGCETDVARPCAEGDHPAVEARCSDANPIGADAWQEGGV